MGIYTKPVIVTDFAANGVIPGALIGGAVAAVKGLSAAALLVAGVAAGLSKGKLKIDSTHTDALTPRKDFSFA